MIGSQWLLAFFEDSSGLTVLIPQDGKFITFLPARNFNASPEKTSLLSDVVWYEGFEDHYCPSTRPYQKCSFLVKARLRRCTRIIFQAEWRQSTWWLNHWTWKNIMRFRQIGSNFSRPSGGKNSTTIKSFNPSVGKALPKCRAIAPFLFPSQYHCVVWVSALPQNVVWTLFLKVQCLLENLPISTDLFILCFYDPWMVRSVYDFVIKSG